MRGEGRKVWDAEGNEYLDFFGGILTTISGHNVPEVVEAIREQAGRMLHSSTLYLIEPAIELAEKIAELSPLDDPKVFFVSSGSEANEAALLLAATYRRSNQVIALRNSYHGRSFATVGVTGNRGWSPSSFSPLTVSYVHGGYRYRSPFASYSDADYIKACADDLRNIIETTTSGDVACMIAEPIQGVGGFAVPPDGFFGAMKEVLDEYGILFVSDEVQTGWGRTGEHFWGIDAHGVTPDLITFAKGIGNGLALAGVIAQPRDHGLDPVELDFDFRGQPRWPRREVLRTFATCSRTTCSRTRKRSESSCSPTSRRPAESSDVVGEVRGKGLMIGIELVKPGTNEPAPGRSRPSCSSTRREAGVLLGKGGLYGNVLRIAPPLSVTQEEATTAARVIADALKKVGSN